MNDNIREGIQMFCEDYEEVRLHTEYSGRGMFGKQGWGITCHSPIQTWGRLIFFLQEQLSEFDFIDFCEEYQDKQIYTDNMGLSNIFYFNSPWNQETNS